LTRKDEAMSLLVSLLIADGGDFVSRPVAKLDLTFHGVAGDRHAGATRLSDARTPWHPRGTPIANTRHVSIVSIEECALIAVALGLPSLDPALLGANLVTGGLEGLTQLAPGTRLQFPSGATIFVTEPNPPCRQPGRKIAAAFGDRALEFAFPKKAVGLRGIVGLVEREGAVAVGDPIKVLKPACTGERTASRKRQASRIG
jgi:MOSC domain-containing protein YiiM